MYVSKLTIIDSDKGLSPDRRQAIILASAGILLIRILRTKLCEILTHWGRVTHLCVGKLTIIGSNNGLSPGRRQAIIRTNAGILSIGPLGTNFSEILIEIYVFSFKKMHMKMSSGKWRHFVSASMCQAKSIYFHSTKCISKGRLRNGVSFISASMCL